jgi:hypothetical protein
MEHIENKKTPKKLCSNNFVQVDDGIRKKLPHMEEMNINKLGFDVKIINSGTWD